jgi:hypothetical protein
MTGASPGQRIHYALTAPSALNGANAAEPTAGSPEYTGPITISSSSIVRASVFSSDNLSRGYPTTGHFVRLANSGLARLDTFSSQMPLVVVDTHGSGALVKDAIDHPAWVYTWNAAANGATMLTTTPALGSSLTTGVRGASSALFPKKSFTLSLNDTLGGGNPKAFFGFAASDHWALVGPWKFDRTFLHNAFVYALSNRLGHWASKTQLVELFFNADGGDLDYNDYAGIYVFTETIRVDPKRVNITPIDPGDTGSKKVTGGYILKSDLPDTDEFSFQTKRNYPGAPFALIVHQPKAAALPQAQRDYVTSYVQGLDDALQSDLDKGFTQATYNDSLDRSSWVDSHIINILAMNPDAFVRSTYFTKDRGARLVAGPVWDFDRTMDGGDDRSHDPERWTGPLVFGDDPPTDLWGYGWWGMLAQDPEYLQEWIDRWQKLRAGELSAANMNALVDSLAAQVSPAAAARDAARWVDDASRYGGAWQGEINNLKAWLAHRATWIDSQFTAPPTFVSAAGALVVTPAPGTQLAYTLDGTDPRAIGGGLSTNARLSSAPINIPDTSDLQVRSYRASAASSDGPTSRWSMLVGGAKSSNLIPRPRLANISSRGFVGTGESVLIAGVVVADTGGKQYVARAVGPALTAFGVSGALAQPVLKILDSTGKQVATNNAWESSPDADDLPDLFKAVGAFPFAKGSRDAALLANLRYGQYTLQVSSGNNGTGVALAELYEVDPVIGRTLNLSTRGLVRAGEGLLIGGVVVRGPAPKRLLIRGVGPGLAAFGVTTALTDPVLTLFKDTTRVASNDDWGTRTETNVTRAEISTASSAVGAFGLPNNSRDAVLLLTLPEGAYTAQVMGKGTAEGVVLLEIYEVP